MDQIIAILSVATAAVTFLAAAVTFVVKFINAVKAKNVSEAARLLDDFAKAAIETAECLCGAPDGPSKKSAAMAEVEAACKKAGIPFDEQAADVAVENLIALTKRVNAASGRDS